MPNAANDPVASKLMSVIDVRPGDSLLVLVNDPKTMLNNWTILLVLAVRSEERYMGDRPLWMVRHLTVFWPDGRIRIWECPTSESFNVIRHHDDCSS